MTVVTTAGTCPRGSRGQVPGDQGPVLTDLEGAEGQVQGVAWTWDREVQREGAEPAVVEIGDGERAAQRAAAADGEAGLRADRHAERARLTAVADRHVEAEDAEAGQLQRHGRGAGDRVRAEVGGPGGRAVLDHLAGGGDRDDAEFLGRNR